MWRRRARAPKKLSQSVGEVPRRRSLEMGKSAWVSPREMVCERAGTRRCRRRRRRSSGNSECLHRARQTATPPTFRYACAYTHRTASDSLIDSMVGVQGDVGARGLGDRRAGQERRSRSSNNRQLTYYVRMGALRSDACARRVTAARVEESWTGCSSRARRPFSLAGWGLHLAQSGINNPNHHIGPAHAVWTGRTPARRTVSSIPGRARESPVVPCSLDPYRAHVVARMLMACVSARPASIKSIIHPE